MRVEDAWAQRRSLAEGQWDRETAGLEGGKGIGGVAGGVGDTAGRRVVDESADRRASITFIQNMHVRAGHGEANPSDSFLPSDDLHRIASDGTLSRIPSPIIRFVPPSPSGAVGDAGDSSNQEVPRSLPPNVSITKTRLDDRQPLSAVHLNASIAAQHPPAHNHKNEDTLRSPQCTHDLSCDNGRRQGEAHEEGRGGCGCDEPVAREERVLPAWITSGGPLSPRHLARMRATSRRRGDEDRNERREEVSSSTAHALPLVKATLVRKRSAGPATPSAPGRRRGIRSVTDTDFAMRLEQRLLHDASQADRPPRHQLAVPIDSPFRSPSPATAARQLGGGGLGSELRCLQGPARTGGDLARDPRPEESGDLPQRLQHSTLGVPMDATSRNRIDSSRSAEQADSVMLECGISTRSPRHQQVALPRPPAGRDGQVFAQDAVCGQGEAPVHPRPSVRRDEGTAAHSDALEHGGVMPAAGMARAARATAALGFPSPRRVDKASAAEPPSFFGIQGPKGRSVPFDASEQVSDASMAVPASEPGKASSGNGGSKLHPQGDASDGGYVCDGWQSGGSPSSSLLSSAATANLASVSFERLPPPAGMAGARDGGASTNSLQSTPRSVRSSARREGDWDEGKPRAPGSAAAGLLCYDDVLGYSFLSAQELARAAAAGRAERAGVGPVAASRIVGGVVLPSMGDGVAEAAPGRGVGVSRLYRAEVSVPSGYAEEFVQYLARRSLTARAP